MNSDDEAFQKFIEVDEQYDVIDESTEESDSDKENQSCSVNSAKTKPEQINKIVAFVKENNEQLIGKPKYLLMWKALSAELNDIGPPKHPVEKWKRIWSVYKYNNRKRLTMILGDEKPSCQGNSSAASLSLVLDSDQQKCKILKHDERSPFQGNSSAASLSLVLDSDQQKCKILKHDERSPFQGNSSAASLSLVLDSDQQKCKILKHDERSPFQGNSSAALQNDMLSLVLEQQKIIIKKLDKHEGLLEEIKKNL